MSKNTWYVAQRTIKGRNAAHAFKLRNNQNIVGFDNDYPGIVTLNACDSMKEAKEIAKAWNDSFKKNGTFLFD